MAITVLDYGGGETEERGMAKFDAEKFWYQFEHSTGNLVRSSQIVAHPLPR